MSKTQTSFYFYETVEMLPQGGTHDTLSLRQLFSYLWEWQEEELLVGEVDRGQEAVGLAVAWQPFLVGDLEYITVARVN